MCSRLNCRFVHLMESDKVEVCDQRVAVCRDHANGQCKRKQCKYYHIPIVLPPANIMATIFKTHNAQQPITTISSNNNNTNSRNSNNNKNNNLNNAKSTDIMAALSVTTPSIISSSPVTVATATPIPSAAPASIVETVLPTISLQHSSATTARSTTLLAESPATFTTSASTAAALAAFLSNNNALSITQQHSNKTFINQTSNAKIINNNNIGTNKTWNINNIQALHSSIPTTTAATVSQSTDANNGNSDLITPTGLLPAPY